MQLIRSVFIVSMITLLFTGSVGIDIFKHICKEDGVSMSLFIEPDHHCKEDVQKKSCCSEEEDNDCCDDEVDHFQIDLDYYHDVVSPDFILSSFDEVKMVFVSEAFISEESLIQNYPQPPPLSGRELLTKKQVWII